MTGSLRNVVVLGALGVTALLCSFETACCSDGEEVHCAPLPEGSEGCHGLPSNLAGTTIYPRGCQVDETTSNGHCDSQDWICTLVTDADGSTRYSWNAPL